MVQDLCLVRKVIIIGNAAPQQGSNVAGGFLPGEKNWIPWIEHISQNHDNMCILLVFFDALLFSWGVRPKSLPSGTALRCFTFSFKEDMKRMQQLLNHQGQWATKRKKAFTNIGRHRTSQLACNANKHSYKGEALSRNYAQKRQGRKWNVRFVVTDLVVWTSTKGYIQSNAFRTNFAGPT